MAVEETQVAELQGRDDEEGEEAKGHIGGVERAAESFGRLAQAGIGGRRVFGVAVTHQTGHGERKHVLEATVPDDGNAPLVLDQEVDHPGQVLIGGANGDDVVAVVGHAGGDGAGLETDAADEGRGGWSVLVAVDHGDFEDVTRWVGHGAVLVDEGFDLAGPGDDLTVEGFDHADLKVMGLIGAYLIERTSGPLVPTLGGKVGRDGHSEVGGDLGGGVELVGAGGL